MVSNMNNKIITLLTLFHLPTMLIGMEITPQQNRCIPLLLTLPNDIKKEISSLIVPTQWWYLQQIFQHDKSVSSVCFDSSGKLLATGS